MKRRHSLLNTTGSASFITTTVIDFIHLFARPALANIVLDNIKYYAPKYDITMYGFVIMPNHIHLLLSAPNQAMGSTFTGKLKEYSAKEILRWCIENNEHAMVTRFAIAASELTHGHKYQVWQQGFDSVAITKQKDMLTKLNYIHNNPLQEHWKLCPSPEEYPFSSAAYYISGKDIGIPIAKIV